MSSSLCMLASNWDGTVPSGGLMTEQKVDGFRAMWFRGIDGVSRLWSRNGIPLPGVEHIAHRLALLEQAAGEGMMFDGEFQVNGNLEATKAWCESVHKLGGEAGIFHLFDGMPDREWRAGGTDQPLYERKARLQELYDTSVQQDDGWTWPEGSRGAPAPIPVQILTDGWALDAADVLDEARRVWAAGGEGVVLKHAQDGYQRRRSSTWLKVKPDGPWWRSI